MHCTSFFGTFHLLSKCQQIHRHSLSHKHTHRPLCTTGQPKVVSQKSRRAHYDVKRSDLMKSESFDQLPKMRGSWLIIIATTNSSSFERTRHKTQTIKSYLNNNEVHVATCAHDSTANWKLSRRATGGSLVYPRQRRLQLRPPPPTTTTQEPNPRRITDCLSESKSVGE